MKSPLMAFLTGLLLAASGVAGSAHVPTGEYVEVRSAEVYTCGCLFSSEAVTAGKETILAWNIQQGGFAGVSLAGLRMAAVIVGDAHLGQYVRQPRASSIYLDEGSTAAQRDAALAFLKSQYADLLGSVIAVRTLPISFRKDNERTYVRVGEIAELIVREALLPQDAHPGSYQWYAPFVPLKQSTLAKTLYYRFAGQEHKTRWAYHEPGITGFTGNF